MGPKTTVIITANCIKRGLIITTSLAFAAAIIYFAMNSPEQIFNPWLLSIPLPIKTHTKKHTEITRKLCVGAYVRLGRCNSSDARSGWPRDPPAHAGVCRVPQRCVRAVWAKLLRVCDVPAWI
jgi:hypothetical protein